MGMLQRLIQAVGGDPAPARNEPRIVAASDENPTSPLSAPEPWLLEMLAGGGGSYSPVKVTEGTSVRSSTVLACVQLVAGLIANLPLKVYQRSPLGRIEASSHRLYPLLHDQPAESMTSFTWRELTTINLLLGGNGYSAIRYDGSSRVHSFDWFPKSAVETKKLPNGRKLHIATHDDGYREPIPDADMLHFMGPSLDGITGLSRIAMARQVIGTDLAIRESVARTHSNRAVPSGLVEVPKGISAEAFKRMKSQFEGAYTGTANAGRVIFADAGAKFSALSLTPEDAQTIESLRFSVQDIARLFGVPPHLVGETSASTSWGSGIEQMTLGFQIFGIGRDLSRIEAELNSKLFKGTGFYCEFSRDALLAMDAKTRGELYRAAIQCGWMTPNEVRRLQNLPPLPGGDRLFMQSGTAPIEQAGSDESGQGIDE